MESTVYRGKIVKVSEQGYGFIICPEIPFTRIFFHWTALKQNTKFTELKKGRRVQFEAKEYNGKGTRAIKIELAPEKETVSDSE